MLPKELSNQVEDIRPIDWGLIHQSIEFFKSRGYRYIDVPYAVPHYVSRITCPKGMDFQCDDLSLVGSAEQSFIHLLLNDKLEDYTPYVTCTPCFRNENEYNNLYQPWFMKVELFSTSDSFDDHLQNALDNFEHILGKDIFLEVIETDNGKDIVYNDIEIGSYGVRHYKGNVWSYGTGIALPRFSEAVKSVTGIFDV